MLNFHQRFMRSTVMNLVAASLRDAKAGGSRELLKGIDTALYFAGDGVQKQVMQTVSRMVQTPSHPYYALIRRAVSDVEPQILQTVLANLGYVAFHAGADQIHETAAKGGIAPEWIETIDLSKSAEGFAERVRQNERQGVYCYEVRCAQQQEALLFKVAAQYEECTFFAEFHQVSQLLAERLSTVPNLIATVDARETESFARLARQRLLYGFRAEQITDGLLRACTEQGCFLGFYQGSTAVEAYSCFSPGGCGQPVLLCDPQRDRQRIQELIIKGYIDEEDHLSTL